MNVIDTLTEKWKGISYSFLIHPTKNLKFSDIKSQKPINLSKIKQGDVVTIIGDFDPQSILTLLQIIDMGVIVVPLTKDTKSQHDYFFESALVDVVIEDGEVTRRKHESKHPLIDQLRRQKHAGLVLFSTGTTGQPKAILHDLTLFLKRFETPRPSLRTINFLLFDHIGGLNTLLHTLFNTGVVVAPKSRTVNSILETCAEHNVEVLPTTPTFLRIMLMSNAIPSKVPSCLRIITYGTERMDQPTLDALCELLPDVDFRQTFGMSELGIVRVKSKARNSLYMKVGGEGVETRVVDSVLQIRSENRMLGYLNASSPFDEEDWYDTKDVVEERNGYYKVVGRTGEVINVGGLKFMASEVEKVALKYENVSLVKAYCKDNPITGQHVEIIVQPIELANFDKREFIQYLKANLQPHMTPKKVLTENVPLGHRYKRA
jgi:long-chain acyl-CoA synthetase